MLQVGLIMLVFLVLVIVGVFLYFVTIYNGLIRLKKDQMAVSRIKTDRDEPISIGAAEEIALPA